MHAARLSTSYRLSCHTFCPKTWTQLVKVRGHPANVIRFQLALAPLRVRARSLRGEAKKKSTEGERQKIQEPERQENNRRTSSTTPSNTQSEVGRTGHRTDERTQFFFFICLPTCFICPFGSPSLLVHFPTAIECRKAAPCDHSSSFNKYRSRSRTGFSLSFTWDDRPRCPQARELPFAARRTSR